MSDFLDLFFSAGTTIRPAIALLNMLVAFGLSLIVYFVYKKSFSGVAYSKKFNITLVMLSLITTIVMNILGNSLALSMGMVGALSIVRFRTAIKDPKDTAYILGDHHWTGLWFRQLLHDRNRNDHSWCSHHHTE